MHATSLCPAVQPAAPAQVTVKKKASSWLVEWTAPPAPVNIKLLYQLCYRRKEEQVSRTTPRLCRDPCLSVRRTDRFVRFPRPLRSARPRTCQWAPRLTAFWSPPWPRPGTTRSRSEPWLPPESISCTGESRRNGATPQTGPPIGVRQTMRARGQTWQPIQIVDIHVRAIVIVYWVTERQRICFVVPAFPPAAWPLQPIYFFIAMCVAAVFLVMYFTVPACRRSVEFAPPHPPQFKTLP